MDLLCTQDTAKTHRKRVRKTLCGADSSAIYRAISIMVIIALWMVLPYALNYQHLAPSVSSFTCLSLFSCKSFISFKYLICLYLCFLISLFPFLIIFVFFLYLIVTFLWGPCANVHSLTSEQPNSHFEHISNTLAEFCKRQSHFLQKMQKFSRCSLISYFSLTGL